MIKSKFKITKFLGSCFIEFHFLLCCQSTWSRLAAGSVEVNGLYYRFQSLYVFKGLQKCPLGSLKIHLFRIF